MLKDRLKEARKNARKSQLDVADAIGITQSAYSQLETGRVDSSSHLPAIAKHLNVDAYWLQTGIESNNLTTIETWDENTPLNDDEVEIPYFKDFSFACGSGATGEALASETRKLRMSKATLRNLTIDKKNAVATRASGNSMNPTIKDGDTIHIDLGRKTIKDGKIFAICHGDLFFAKRLYNLPLGGVRIVSDNAAEFPEVQLNAQEIIDQKFEIVGWIWQISSIESW
ncbi:XRE family transcriptional regulator [Acinetobacter sp. ULE_I010]|uniref:XRE family transcriptional regulator n=1 Tax=Acinetobacter sp. ULE_I010 TaxID=3373065 RepID=UPI003AF7569E